MSGTESGDDDRRFRVWRMEAITLIKHWHRRRQPRASEASSNETRMVVGKEETHDDGHSSSDADDEGPFFDLEFEVPDGNDGGMQGEEKKLDEEMEEEEEEEEEEEFNFPSCVGGDGDVLDFPVSPSDDLFFKGKFIVPVSNTSSSSSSSATSTSTSTTTTTTTSTTTTTTSTPSSSCSLGLASETTKPLFLPVSFLKSATRFRVLMTGLKKSKPSISDNGAKRSQKRQFFTVKFRIEDVRVPNFSLFTRDNKGQTAGAPLQTKPDGISPTLEETEEDDEEEEDEDVEKGFKKEVLQKYLEKIKPLYMRATAYKKHISTTSDDSRSGDGGGLEKLTTEEESNSESERDRERDGADGESSPEELVVLERVNEEVTESLPEKVENINNGNMRVATTRSHKLVQVATSHLPAGLRAVCDNLVKKKPTTGDAFPTSALGGRRDDSLVQQQDGIQSAINHCKRSLHSTGAIK